MTEIKEIQKETIRILESSMGKILPRQTVIKKLMQNYNSKIDKAIWGLLDDFIIDMVLDYPPDDSGIEVGHPIWHLILLSTTEAEKLRKLPPIKIALLRILQGTDDSYYPGEIPVDEAILILKERDFEERDVERLFFIEDRVRCYDVTRDGRSVRCYCIIPEYEKTEEYKREQERIHQEWLEKDLKRQYLWDVLEIATDIRIALRSASEGLSREDIIAQIPKFPQDYIDEAFRTAIDDGDIEKIEHLSGKEWYILISDEEDEHGN